jgi:hypothetical protein
MGNSTSNSDKYENVASDYSYRCIKHSNENFEKSCRKHKQEIDKQINKIIKSFETKDRIVFSVPVFIIIEGWKPFIVIEFVKDVYNITTNNYQIRTIYF